MCRIEHCWVPRSTTSPRVETWSRPPSPPLTRSSWCEVARCGASRLMPVRRTTPVCFGRPRRDLTSDTRASWSGIGSGLPTFDPRVTWIAGQPFWFKGGDGGCPRRHVPDFLLRLSDEGFLVVDVKPERMLAKPAVAEVLEWTGRLCAVRGWGYEVWSGADPAVMENIKFLAVGRRRQFLDEEVLAVVATVGRSGMTVTAVESLVAGRPRGLVRAAVFSLLWSGRWSTDPSLPLRIRDEITPHRVGVSLGSRR